MCVCIYIITFWPDSKPNSSNIRSPKVCAEDSKPNGSNLTQQLCKPSKPITFSNLKKGVKLRAGSCKSIVGFIPSPAISSIVAGRGCLSPSAMDGGYPESSLAVDGVF